jgi:hypothetical protein
VSCLVAILGSSGGDSLKATAASTLARLLRASPALMGGLVDAHGVGVMLAGGRAAGEGGTRLGRLQGTGWRAAQAAGGARLCPDPLSPADGSAALRLAFPPPHLARPAAPTPL